MHSKHTQMDILAQEMTMSAVAAASLKMKDNDLKKPRMEAEAKCPRDLTECCGPYHGVNVRFFLLMVSQFTGPFSLVYLEDHFPCARCLAMFG